MPRLLPCALVLLLQLAPARGVEDASALVQKSLVTFDEYYDQFFTPSQEELEKYWTYRKGQRVQVEGYSPDTNVTIIGYGVDRERYHLTYGRDGNIMNIEGKYLKKWEPTYPMSTDPAAGPIATIQGFEYQGKPYIVRRGEKKGSWDVYIPSMGLVQNIDDGSIIREQSWRRTSSTLPPKEPSLMAVLTGRVPPGYSYSHKNKKVVSSTTLAPQAKSSVETIYPERKGETEAEPEKVALEAPAYFLPPYVPPMVPPPYMMRPPPQAALERKMGAKDFTVSKRLLYTTPLDQLRTQEQLMAKKNDLAKRRLKEQEDQFNLDKTLSEHKRKALKNHLMQESELKSGQEILDKHQVLEKRILEEEIQAIQQQNTQREQLLKKGLGAVEQLSQSQRILRDQLNRTEGLAAQLRREKEALAARAAQQDAALTPSAAKASQWPKLARKSALMTRFYRRKKEAQSEEQGTEEEAAKEAETDDVAERLAVPARGRPGRKLVILDTDGEGLGFTASQFRGSYKERMLLVESIENSGAVARWNQKHPVKALTQGERILQVNGEGGNSKKLQGSLQAVANSNKVYLLVEKVSEPIEKSFKRAIITAQQAMTKVMKNGLREYVREALPFHLGKIFMNKAQSVKECGHISSQMLCGQSKQKYNLTCAGWSGAICLSPEEAQCEMLTNEGICNDAKTKFGLTCAGWGGKNCLSQDAHPSAITSLEICEHAEKRLGILVAGWGGDKCLAPDSTCSEISKPGLCNSAESKLGKNCLGWGGSSCLDHDSKAELITDEHFCKKSMLLFGIESAGWGGSACLSNEGLKCDFVTDESICNSAEARLGRKCAGWGGSSCLEQGASAEQITAEGICSKSNRTLGIQSAGWSGTRCLPAGPVSCSDIERPGVCNAASARLGIQCAGWTGKECLSKEDMKCNRVLKKPLCETAAERFGLPCVWNKDMNTCLPDTSSPH